VLTERRKGVMNVRRELLPHRGEVRRRLWKDISWHDVVLLSCSVCRLRARGRCAWLGS
jgi:hypothetical protein